MSCKPCSWCRLAVRRPYRRSRCSSGSRRRHRSSCCQPGNWSHLCSTDCPLACICRRNTYSLVRSYDRRRNTHYQPSCIGLGSILCQHRSTRHQHSTLRPMGYICPHNTARLCRSKSQDSKRQGTGNSGPLQLLSRGLHGVDWGVILTIWTWPVAWISTGSLTGLQ